MIELTIELYRFPFDEKNTIGYLAAILMEFFVIQWETRFVACFLNLALVVFMFSFVFASDIKNSVHTIDKSIKTKEPESVIIKQLIEFVGMHCDAKKLSYI